MNFTPEEYLKKIKQAALNSVYAFGYEAITVDGTVKNFTIPTGASYAFCILESDATGIAIRTLQSGVTPVSTTVGMGMANSGFMDVVGAQNLAGFQVTQAQGGTHILHVEYYK